MSRYLPKILVVEDDKNMGYLLTENLKVSGFDPTLCINGQEGIDVFDKETFDLCLLDVMLPRKDGFTLALEIRKSNEQIPIIFLTAKSLDEDKIAGFKSGCDDYVTKPFNIEELVLRIRAILKRNTTDKPSATSETLAFGRYVLNYFERKLIHESSEIQVSTKEADLLRILVIHKNEVIPRNIILKEVWGVDDYYVSKSLDVYLNKIRKHFHGDPKIEIMNIHGYGYKLLVKE